MKYLQIFEEYNSLYHEIDFNDIDPEDEVKINEREVEDITDIVGSKYVIISSNNKMYKNHKMGVPLGYRVPTSEVPCIAISIYKNVDEYFIMHICNTSKQRLAGYKILSEGDIDMTYECDEIVGLTKLVDDLDSIIVRRLEELNGGEHLQVL